MVQLHIKYYANEAFSSSKIPTCTKSKFLAALNINEQKHEKACDNVMFQIVEIINYYSLSLTVHVLDP